MPADIPIRPYQEHDFAAVCALDAICFSESIAYPPEEVAYFLGQRGALCLVATTADNAAANDGARAAANVVAWILGHARCGGAGHIVTIDVHPGHRRRGIGDALMNQLEDAFRCAGCTVARLEVATDNLGAQAFYQRRGYATRRTIRNYYANGGDAYLMELKL